MNPLLITGIGSIIEKILSSVLPDSPKDKLEAARVAIEARLAEDAPLLEQIKVNVEEAKHESLFVAGWRPAIGWTCAAAFIWTFVLQPMLIFICMVTGHPLTNLPIVSTTEIMPVLLGMLGLAGYRTFEKTRK